MNNEIINEQKKILSALAGKIDTFYLAGGTALSLFYYNHRLSIDLDFFTQELYPEKVQGIINELVKATQKNIVLIGENLSSEDHADIMVYNIEYAQGKFLKIDFVKDVLPLIKETKRKNNIRILSIEDVYLRKIYAVSGLCKGTDEFGRAQFMGGRQEAKDLFDIYILSKEFLGLADFVETYCEQALKEGLIRWFRTFKRIDMKIGLTEINTHKHIDFKKIDKHIDNEIKRILIREIDVS